MKHRGCYVRLVTLCSVVCCFASQRVQEINDHVFKKLINKFGENGRLSEANFQSLGLSVKVLKRDTSLSCNITDKECDFFNLTDQCIGYRTIFDALSQDGSITRNRLKDALPLMVYAAQSDDCRSDYYSRSPHGRKKPTIGQAWGYGIGFCTLIVIISNIGVFLGPFMKTRIYQRILMFCVALAVGTLASTGFLVLLPESMHLTADDSPIPNYHWKMSTVMGGAYFVFVAEKLLHATLKQRKCRKETELEVSEVPGDPLMKKTATNGHGHSHFEVGECDGGKKTVAPVAWILLIGDALHNFVDGLSIGAAFTENTFVGISVSLAVVCEELPHELGDIAILLHSGLSMKRALLYNFLAAVTCYIGLIIGVVVGENTQANQWIFGFAAGLFIYISLSDMIPEMAQQLREAESEQPEGVLTVFILQNSGLLCGFAIILSLVVFGSNIKL